MNNNMKNTKKKMMMRGFMCQSQASTAICMNPEFGSAIVPRRVTDKRSSLTIDDTRLTNNSKYTRLIESGRFKFNQLSDKKPAFNNNNNSNNTNDNKKEDQVSRLRDPNTSQKHPSVPDSSNHVFQVVVMRVALHCQGCAGKVKKHLSKMEGVTSFSIELETKRVTVMGHVSPVGVLESISKVKRAEFWSC